MAYFATLGQSGSRTQHLGQVATRCEIPQSFFATNKQIQARRGHYAMDDIVNPKIVVPGFYMTNFSNGATYLESKTGANTIWSAAIEYPVGTMTQIKWNGATTISVPDGAFSESDACTLYIPRGALFYIRMYMTNTAGIIFTEKAAKHLNSIGDQMTAAPSGLTDNTMSGAYGTDDTNNCLSVLAIVSQTYNPSVVILGDSRAFGETEVADTTYNGDIGEHARALGQGIAYANYGVRGDSAYKFLASCNNRVQLARRYFTHMITNYGINDIESGGRLPDQIINDRLQISALTGLPMMHTTVLPHANGGNTAANNTTFEAIRVKLNQKLRSRSATSTEVVVDSANVVENVVDQPVWKATYSTDFLHPNAAGCTAIAAASVIKPVLFVK